MGAFDGESYSNTSCLADLGWRGLYIEPVPTFAAGCRERHKQNLGIRVIEVAVSDTDGIGESPCGERLYNDEP